MRIEKVLRSAATSAILAGLFVAVALTAPAQAGGPAFHGIANPDLKASASYWTPERMREARPMPLPKVSASAIGGDAAEADSAVEANGQAMSADGAPPTVKYRPEMAERFVYDGDVSADEFEAARAALEDYDAIEGNNVGTAGAHFSSTRVFPDAATTTYPYLTVGKLFFTIPGQGAFICSGSVLRSRIILTAGHCVHNGNNSQSGFYTNFLFVPAYKRIGNVETRPVGIWNWAYVATTGTWFSGGSVFPNAADYAMIEAVDQSGNRIGDRTGTLGYQTLKLNPNHAHLLGYPANLDSGFRMHEVTAESFRNTPPNTVEYGSDMRGGSSGGPWVQNFGVVSSGQTAGLNTGSNRVIGITSYGFVSTTPLTQGSSIPDSRFTSLLTFICNHRTANCP